MEAYKAVITSDTNLILGTDEFLRYLKSSDEPTKAVTPSSASNDPLKGLPTLLDLVNKP